MEAMTEDIYTVVILALLPLTAGMLVSQVNPYHALVIRGILGAVSALVYALFGAADVALTEALVGTMLSITLYAVAVRSSMSMRLGVTDTVSSEFPEYETFVASLRSQLQSKHLRLEVVPFSQAAALQTALADKQIHGALVELDTLPDGTSSDTKNNVKGAQHCLQIRVHRLYEILSAKLSTDTVNLRFADLENLDVAGRK